MSEHAPHVLSSHLRKKISTSFESPSTTTDQKQPATISVADGGLRKRQTSQQPRQLLSCTKCRERKVKCDRIKPCSACCARGASKECHFIAEGGDYAPIQQSYELRKLRAENLRHKERLRACKIPVDEDEESEVASPDSLGDRGTGGVGDRGADREDRDRGERGMSSVSKRRAARQRRFQGSGWSDSVYFGSPGLASVIMDFASINLAPISAQSLAHLMPRGPDLYTTASPPPHAFATMFPHTPDECIPALLSLLRLPEAKEELLADLDSFEKRVQVCSFPYVPIEITKGEVERFLADPIKNAGMYPDMLALLFAALALGSQFLALDRSNESLKGGDEEKNEVEERELRKGDVYIAASMQALRLASFMHRPTLLGIQALIMMGPFLTNSGRFLDAWTLFGTTIRLAHSIGLHRHPKYLDPAPPTQRECFIRQTLWWWMLHMDTQYSMTLGRPLGISGIGDCPPPHELTTDPRVLRFGEFTNHFTVLARQVLSADRLTNAKIDEFTEAFRGLLETLPETLQFDEGWLDEGREIPEWPLGTMAAVFYCKTHTYLILLNRQRIEKSQPCNASIHPSRASPPSHSSTYPSPISQSLPTASRGRPLVLQSCTALLTAFIFFHSRAPAALICWTMGQQAFNSCMILLLDAMETGSLERIGMVEKSYVVFLGLERKGIRSGGLVAAAVERISWGLSRLGRMNGRGVDVATSTLPMDEAGARADHCDVEMQGTGGNACGSGGGNMQAIPRDTVMGNTGMLLLEDPGLQAFVPEAFRPFDWDTNSKCASAWDIHMTLSRDQGARGLVKQEGDMEEKEHDAEDVGESVWRGKGNVGDEAHGRSSEVLMGGLQTSGAGTMVSTGPAVVSIGPAAPLQQHYKMSQAQAQAQAPQVQADTNPQGLAPSPITPSASTRLQHGSLGTTTADFAPPHLRHHSYPGFRQYYDTVPPPSQNAGSDAQLRHEIENRLGNTSTGGRVTVPPTRHPPPSHIQSHNNDTHLSTLSECTSTTATQPPDPSLSYQSQQYHVLGTSEQQPQSRMQQHPNPQQPNAHHPSWAARLISISAPETGFAERVIPSSQQTSSHTQQQQQQHHSSAQQTHMLPAYAHWQYNVPFQISSAAATGGEESCLSRSPGTDTQALPRTNNAYMSSAAQAVTDEDMETAVRGGMDRWRQQTWSIGLGIPHGHC